MVVFPHISLTLIHFNPPPSRMFNRGQRSQVANGMTLQDSPYAILCIDAFCGHVPPHAHQGIAHTAIATWTQLLSLEQPKHTVKVLVCALNASR